ncbi:MAG: hypothetical protein ACREOZ_00265, partial [Gloeomargaritales cyanobacterium]
MLDVGKMDKELAAKLRSLDLPLFKLMENRTTVEDFIRDLLLLAERTGSSGNDATGGEDAATVTDESARPRDTTVAHEAQVTASEPTPWTIHEVWGILRDLINQEEWHRINVIFSMIGSCVQVEERLDKEIPETPADGKCRRVSLEIKDGTHTHQCLGGLTVGLLKCSKSHFIGSVYEKLAEMGVKCKPYATKEGVIKLLETRKQEMLTQWDDNVIKYVPDFVETYPKRGDIHATSDVSKAQAIVIAGESGSGKTWFALNKVTGPGYSCIYCNFERVTGFQFDKISDEWGNFLGKVISMLHVDHLKSPSYNRVSELMKVLNEKRNTWAYHEAIRALRGLFPSSSKLPESEEYLWWKGQSGVILDKIVIVFDEVGKDLEFARGMVNMTIKFLNAFADRAKKVELVLCGTALDYLSSGKHG